MGATVTMDEFGLGLGGDETVPAKPAKAAKVTGRKMFTIYVDEEEQQPNFITVGVNGKQYQIMRGVDVEVPEEVIEVLKHTVADRLIQRTNPTTGLVETTLQKFNRIPYRIVRM